MVSGSAAGTVLGRMARTWQQQRSQVRRYPWIPLTIVVIMAICALFAGLISPHDPRGRDETSKSGLRSPGWRLSRTGITHWAPTVLGVTF